MTANSIAFILICFCANSVRCRTTNRCFLWNHILTFPFPPSTKQVFSEQRKLRLQVDFFHYVLPSASSSTSTAFDALLDVFVENDNFYEIFVQNILWTFEGYTTHSSYWLSIINSYCTTFFFFFYSNIHIREVLIGKWRQLTEIAA